MNTDLAEELGKESSSLLGFGKGAAAEHGFGWLDDEGNIDRAKGAHLWITGRMTHCFALGHILGESDCFDLAAHGITTLLNGPLRSGDGSRWFSAVDANGSPLPGPLVSYDHSFVILAAASGVIAGVPLADDLLDASLRTFDGLWWDESAGMVVDSRDSSSLAIDPYRGANANMHTVEALLAAWSATHDDSLLVKAERISSRILGFFLANDFRLPEHFDAQWVAQLGYNEDRPADAFRPFGSTIGHWLEWSRLMTQVAVSCDHAGIERDPRLDVIPAHMYRRALMEGWGVDEESGFIYTIDFHGRPVVHQRMYWVLCEAIGAAATLRISTSDPTYAEDIACFWQWAKEFLIEKPGAWREELDSSNHPASGTWSGKPDIYHALQATLIPGLPLAPSFAAALDDGSTWR